MTGNNPKLDLVIVDAHKILSICSLGIERKQILTPIKGRNSVKSLQKMTGNNLKLDLSMLICIQIYVRFCQFVLKTLSGNEILT